MAWVVLLIHAFLIASKASNVIELDETTLANYIQSGEKIIVKFYAEWCGHCQQLAPIYSDLADWTSENLLNLKIGKLNAPKYKEAMATHKIQYFPTLIYFYEGKHCIYDGGKGFSDLQAWATKVSKNSSKVNLQSELDELLAKKQHFMAVSFSDENSEVHSSYLNSISCSSSLDIVLVNEQIAKSNDFQLNGYTIISNGKIIRKLEHESSVTVNSLKNLWFSNTQEKLMEFTQDNIEKIFASISSFYAVFLLNKNSESFENHLRLGESVSNFLFEKIRFTYATSDNPLIASLNDFFGLKHSDEPIFCLFNSNNKRFIFNGSFVQDEILRFSQDVLDGKIKAVIKSQDLPANWNEKSVKIIVSTSLKEFVTDSVANSFIMFYAQNCVHCKNFHPILDEVAEHFKDKQEIKFGSIDAVENEFDDIEIKGYPTIIIFRKDFSNQLQYNCNRSKEAVIDVINKVINGDSNESITKSCSSQTNNHEENGSVQDAEEEENDFESNIEEESNQNLDDEL